MGLYATNYVVYGFQISKKEIKKLSINHFSDKFIPYIEGGSDIQLSLIYDQVCGDYIVFGKELHSQGEHENNTIKAIPLKELSTLDWEETYKITQKFIECVGEDTFNQLKQKEPQLLIFTHYA
jgi:hypothetical protein